MEKGFSQLLDSAASVLVLLPQNPSFDSVSGGLSLYMALMDKKSVSISCPSPMTVGMNRVIGVQKITPELGNKNLTIKFKNYDAANIEKVSYDIINGEFNLTVVPKAGFVAPTQEQMEVSFSGVSADLIVLIGGASDADFPVLSSEELANAKVAHVGIRPLSSRREVMSFATSGSTISEVVAKMVRENGLNVDPDIATNLLMGIEEGTANFASGDVTAETFEIFAHLLRSGGRRASRVKVSPMGFPPGAIPTQPYGAPSMPQMSQPMPMPVAQVPGETDAIDKHGTAETEQEINPPDDWLQPKVFKGSAQPSQPTTFSENKG